MKDDKDVGKFYTPEDATETIRSLSAEQKRRLAAVARRRAWFSGDHEGLLWEAIASTATGRRRWNRSVDIMRHLDLAMRSINWNAAKRSKVAADNSEEISTRDEWRDEAPSSEAALEVQEEVEEQHAKAIELCGDDWEVKLLVEGLLNNSTPEELVELFGDKTSYETVRKRMNRRIKKYRAQDDSK
ncbi:hypothetical protein [Paracoccus jeotgali]|uniref:hypothetical protein n=1 Tax=Paracoccus jeotgali TaxID=2065379 RepID=UPI0028AB0FD1|nr:hypothetical protein [Paracoccus jeotgali]